MDKELKSVLAAVIQEGDRFLLCLRPVNKRYGGHWEFPGGKVLDGESFEDALRRELSEELGVGVAKIGQLLFESRDPDSQFLIQFVEVKILGVPQPLEHEQLAWVSLNDLLNYKLPPSDQEFARSRLVSQ